MLWLITMWSMLTKVRHTQRRTKAFQWYHKEVCVIYHNHPKENQCEPFSLKWIVEICTQSFRNNPIFWTLPFCGLIALFQPACLKKFCAKQIDKLVRFSRITLPTMLPLTFSYYYFNQPTRLWNCYSCLRDAYTIDFVNWRGKGTRRRGGSRNSIGKQY